MGERGSRTWAVIVVVVLCASCGSEDDGGNGTGGGAGGLTASTSTHPTTARAVTATTVDAEGDRLEGVAVASGQTMAPPYPWWWVVDLAAGTTIEGRSRVVVEVAQNQLGCGDEHHPIGSFQIAVGDSVTFELADGEPGARPEFWLPPGEDTYADEPAVRGRQFRVDCPAGTAAAATALAAARERWDQVGPSSYEFAMTWHVFNDTYGDYRIAVADGKPVSIVRGDGSRLDPARVEGDLPRTIDELFDTLAREVSADSFEASYDPELGYPTSVLVDEIREGVDDELEVSVPELTPGPVTAPTTVAPPIGQRIQATTVDWNSESPDGSSFWLVVDATGGITVEGSSRLTVQIPVTEVRCGAELRPVETLQSLQGGTVSFELVDVGAGPVPNDTPMWNAGPAVTGRELHLPTCPPTTDDRAAGLTAARDRWAAAGIDDYQLDLVWSTSLTTAGMIRVTVVDGQATSIVALDEYDRPGPPVSDPAILETVPLTVEALFDEIVEQLPNDEVDVGYDEQLGYPHRLATGAIVVDARLRTTD